jgi:hypothetical protein
MNDRGQQPYIQNTTRNKQQMAAQIRQTTRKGKKANTHTRIRKLTKTQQKNTNENVRSITTFKKRQQKAAKQIPSGI